MFKSSSDCNLSNLLWGHEKCCYFHLLLYSILFLLSVLSTVSALTFPVDFDVTTYNCRLVWKNINWYWPWHDSNAFDVRWSSTRIKTSTQKFVLLFLDKEHVRLLMHDFCIWTWRCIKSDLFASERLANIRESSMSLPWASHFWLMKYLIAVLLLWFLLEFVFLLVMFLTWNSY